VSGAREFWSRLGQRELFKTILNEQKLRFDREGRSGTAYSQRHTYICLRLCASWRVADIYQIAKNCSTSVEMMEKYYAAHIKTALDARQLQSTSCGARRTRT
jgi:hypothetical protein